MKTTALHLDTRFQAGPVDPRIFGGFLEHMGRAVYEGVYDPKSRHADADGFRTDVLDALRPLRMTAMRYPGGNFASGYHWLDGVGPRDKRSTVRELAWQSREPNQFGTDEYVRLCRKMDWTPMLTVNLGTGAPEEARNWVEYCNAPAGTRWADLRAANGSPATSALRTAVPHPTPSSSGASATKWTARGSSATYPPGTTPSAPSRPPR
jgi:alpha-L-arabinofuranosidase